MYDEFLCEACPLLIGGNDDWVREYNKEQLARSADYWERNGDIERAEEIRKQIKYI